MTEKYHTLKIGRFHHYDGTKKKIKFDMVEVDRIFRNGWENSLDYPYGGERGIYR